MNKKSSENDQLTGHFQSFLLYSFFYYFFYISRKNSKTSEVNFNLYIFHHFPKNLDMTLLTVPLSKMH